MKLIVCASCEAEFSIRHLMDDHFYKIKFCPFCSEELIDENELVDEIEEWEDDN